MSKAILISIQPKWVEKILNREKAIEIRKTMPKCNLPIDVYIYCSKQKPYLYECYGNAKGDQKLYYFTNDFVLKDECLFNGKVVAKFTLNETTDLHKMNRYKATGLVLYKGAMDMGEFYKYGGQYAWHIDNLEIFDMPKELGEFYKSGFNEDLDKYKDHYTWGVRFYPEERAMELQNSYDEDINTLRQTWRISKAPQSWCYVEVE